MTIVAGNASRIKSIEREEMEEDERKMNVWDMNSV